MRSKTGKRSRLGKFFAFALLAFTFKATLFPLCEWGYAHRSLVCFLAAVFLLLRTCPDAFRRTARWIARAVVDAVRSVMPQDLDAAAPGRGAEPTDYADWAATFVEE